MGGAFVLYTGGGNLEAGAHEGAGSLISQALLGYFYALSALLLATSPVFWSIIKRTWPILLIPVLAIVSTTWAPDQMLSLRRAIAFTGTVLFGLSLGAAFPLERSFKLLIWALAIVMFSSIAIVFGDPVRGVHQATDATQWEHAGLWRGAFAHRNTLGFWAGMAFGATLMFGRSSFPGPIMWAGAVLAGFACLIGAHSGAGFVVAAMVVGLSVGCIILARQPAGVRGALLVWGGIGAVIAIVFWDVIFTFTLELLGKDPSLTGRTLIWQHIVEIVEDASPLIGLGYYTGYVQIDEQLALMRHSVARSAHNGYLESFVYFGIMGPLLLFSVLIWLAHGTFLEMLRSTRAGSSLPIILFVAVIVAAVHNMVESTLVVANNLPTVLVAMAGGQLARRRAEEHASVPDSGRIVTA